MKLPPFDYARRQWDYYKEFHVAHDRQITQFETGELLVHPVFHKPVYRKAYHPFRFQVFCIGDQPRVMQEGKLWDPHNHMIVKKSWLGRFTPLLLDWDSRRVVSAFYRFSGDADKAVPSRFISITACCYFAGEGRLPVPATGMTYHSQNKFTPEDRKEVKDKLLQIRARVRIGAVVNPNAYPPLVKHYYWNDFRDTPIAQIPDYDMYGIAKYGFVAGTTAHTVSWLEFKGRIPGAE
jgi:hypothetical protein